MSDENDRPPTATNNSIAPVLYYINTKSRVKFDGSCLKQDKATFTHKKMVNIYFVYEINLWPFNVDKYFALGNSFFRTNKLTENADTGRYKYSGNGVGFDARGSFSLSDGSGFGKNIIIFGADMSSY